MSPRWAEVGHCPLAEVDQMAIAVTSWFEAVSSHGLRWMDHCPLAEVGPMGVIFGSACGLRWTWLSVTSWSEVVGDHCGAPHVEKEKFGGYSNFE